MKNFTSIYSDVSKYDRSYAKEKKSPKFVEELKEENYFPIESSKGRRFFFISPLMKKCFSLENWQIKIAVGTMAVASIGGVVLPILLEKYAIEDKSLIGSNRFV